MRSSPLECSFLLERYDRERWLVVPEARGLRHLVQPKPRRALPSPNEVSFTETTCALVFEWLLRLVTALGKVTVNNKQDDDRSVRSR